MIGSHLMILSEAPNGVCTVTPHYASVSKWDLYRRWLVLLSWAPTFSGSEFADVPHPFQVKSSAVIILGFEKPYGIFRREPCTTDKTTMRACAGNQGAGGSAGQPVESAAQWGRCALCQAPEARQQAAAFPRH